ncbi:hypothetical protein ACJQWK_02609 [Exserohilum turcicum]
MPQNARRRPHMTIEDRGVAIGMLRGGATYKEVAEQLGRDPSTIRALHQKFNQTGTMDTRPRSGRPPILSDHQKKIVYWAACAMPKSLYEDLVKVASFVKEDGTISKPPSLRTLSRVLRSRGLVNYRCKLRPNSTATHAQNSSPSPANTVTSLGSAA